MTLERYNKKREEWSFWLSGDQTNSIMPQITNLVTNSAVLHVVASSIKNSPKDEHGNNMLNGLIWNTFTGLYAQSQAFAIRRLLDPRKDVYSLRRLLDDLRKHKDLITRENVLEAHGVAIDLLNEFNIKKAQKKHIFFDMLANVKIENRHENDCLDESVINRLFSILGKYKGSIGEYVNKFIAHSATKESVAMIDSELLEINYQKLWDAEKDICRIAHLMQLLIENKSTITVVQSPVMDKFIYIDQPLVQPDKIELLRETWKKYEIEAQSWMDYDWLSK